MNASSIVAAVALTVVLAACGAGSSSAPASAGSGSPSAPASAAPATPATPSTVSSAASAGTLIGSWHRAQSCQDMRAAFQRIGLAESHEDWLAGNFFGGSPAPTGDDACAGAQGPFEHSHFFTAAGGFGSHDENGQQVDDGDYAVIDADTLSFPSHQAEFKVGVPLLVDYVVSGDTATFTVALPASCDAACRDGYAWATSAFASGPWARGDVP